MCFVPCAVTHEVVEGEAIVTGDVVDAVGGPSRVGVGAARDACAKGSSKAVSALDEVSHCVFVVEVKEQTGRSWRGWEE